ncbi:MAG: HEPN domain-containing protein [Gammaproteobacteria bacterium]
MKDEARKLIEKAERTLNAARMLAQADSFEVAVGRAYYAMLHTAQALLRDRDLRYRRHAGVHAAYGQHFARTGALDPKYHRWLLAAFNLRLQGDYDIDASLDRETAVTLIAQAGEFLDAAKRYLARA